MDQFFDTFQITCMAFFLVVFVGRTLYMIFRKNINPIVLGAGKKGLNQIIELLFFVGLFAWIVEVILAALHTEFRIFPSLLEKQLFDITIVKLIGVIMVLVSLALFIWALLSFRDSWRVGIDTRNAGGLISTGIFAYSRNPIFVFVDLYFIGTFLINGTPVFLVFAAVVVIGLHYQILQEEAYLKEAHGAVYREFCERTGRYWKGHKSAQVRKINR